MATENEISEVSKPRSGIGCLKIIGWGLVLLALFAVIGVFWNHTSATSKLQETLAELDRTDPGWRLEDIEAAREQIPEEENSAGVIIAAAQNLPRSWPPEDLSVEYFWLQPPNEMLSGEGSVHLSVELTRVRPALEIAGKLADMPRGRHRLRDSRSTVFPAFPADRLNSQRIGTLLVLESLWWNQRGESDKALMACRAALNAARSMGDEPSQLSQFIRRCGIEHACWAIERTLGQGEPPSENMAALQKQIEIEDAFPAQLLAARAERALGHRVFEGVQRGEVSLDDLTARRMGWLERTASPLWSMDVREDHALFLSLTTRRIHDVQRPVHEQAELNNKFVEVVRSLPKRAIITQSLLPAASTAGETFRCKQAYLRCTIAALAAERFRGEKKAWPDRVDQLCPQYLAAVPLDPFDGKPLRYRRGEEGAIIYSIGQDSVDNNGDLDREHPNQPGVDIGFRLWDTAKRRQPPQPKPAQNEKPQ
jgi:hypothetical protein